MLTFVRNLGLFKKILSSDFCIIRYCADLLLCFFLSAFKERIENEMEIVEELRCITLHSPSADYSGEFPLFISEQEVETLGQSV